MNPIETPLAPPSPPVVADAQARLALGERLREARLYLGFSPEEVEMALKLPPTLLASLERGERAASPAEVERLAGFLGTSAEHLLTSASLVTEHDRQRLIEAMPDIPPSTADQDAVLRFMAYLRLTSTAPPS